MYAYKESCYDLCMSHFTLCVSTGLNERMRKHVAVREKAAVATHCAQVISNIDVFSAADAIYSSFCAIIFASSALILRLTAHW